MTGPSDYVWATDGLSTGDPFAYTLHVDGVVQGVTGPREYHVARVDGRFRIFADCGDPSP